MAIAGWGFAPALAAGNTVVVKPAELTPLSALRLGELALEAGLPEGVLQILPGKGSVVGQRFVAHPAVRKVCFTGSTEVGRAVMAGCAAQVKRVTLELGGKSRQHRLRRRRPRAGRRPGARTASSTTRAGLLRPLAHLGRAHGLRPLHGAARAGRARGGGRRPDRRVDARWGR